MYERILQWYREHHSDATTQMLESLEETVNPVFDPPVAPKTSQSALKQLEVDLGLIVHPQCPNSECSHVFYEILRREDFEQVPARCPDCEGRPRDLQNRITVLHFPRRSLSAELEYVLRTPCLEDALERRGERKSQRDRKDAEETSRGVQWSKVYREQDDGAAWNQRAATHSRLAGQLWITVNLTP